MTYEEALIDLQSIYKGHGGLYTDDSPAWKLAFDALEKQISKKPVQKEYMYGWTNYCPACRKVLFRNSIMENGEIKYCEHCGQALDWSGEG